MESSVLQAGLQAWGVPLIDGVSTATVHPDFGELFEALVRSRNPRFVYGAVAILLRHPDRAVEASDRAVRLDGPAGREARILYTAAAACQSLLRTRLELAGIDSTPIPDRFSALLDLPPADERYGRPCLAAMDDLPSAWDGRVYARSEPYLAIADLLIETLHAARR